MLSARREVWTRLPADVVWERVTRLAGEDHWGAAARSFELVRGDGGGGSRLRSSTYVDDHVVVTDVDVVRREREGSEGVLVLHGSQDLGTATEVLAMMPADGGLLVSHEMVFAVAVDLGPMRLWLGRFADLLRDGLARALEADERG